MPSDGSEPEPGGVPPRRISPRAWAAIGCTILGLLLLALLAGLVWLASRGLERLQSI